MENQKIINLLDKIDTDSKHFATKKWYIINDENNTNYGVNKDTGANNPDTIKYDTRVLKPNLCDYAEAYILVDGTIRPDAADANTRLVLKNCAPFTKCTKCTKANAINDLTINNSSSFRYKVSLLGNPVVADNIAKINVKVVIPLNYLSNFFRSLKMPLINCKIKLNLT